MTTKVTAPALILGATGVVGAKAVKLLRTLHPDLPIAIGARDQDKCRALAEEVGNAVAVKPDLSRADLGLGGEKYSAVVALLKENTLNPLRFAQAHGLPYINMADGAFEIGPAVARFVYKPGGAPIMLAGHWVVGMTTLPALFFAREFKTIDKIAIAVILDPQEPVGPMAHEDVEQVMQNSPRPLMLVDGTWRWVGEDLGRRHVRNSAGEDVEVQAMTVHDTISLAAATEARSVRLDFAMARTASQRRGEGPSHEIIIELEGEKKDGTTGRLRVDLETPQGCQGLTALGVAVGLERLLGLAGGAPAAPGLYFPETLVDPSHAMERFKQFGGQFRLS